MVCLLPNGPAYGAAFCRGQILGPSSLAMAEDPQAATARRPAQAAQMPRSLGMGGYPPYCRRHPSHTPQCTNHPHPYSVPTHLRRSWQ